MYKYNDNKYTFYELQREACFLYVNSFYICSCITEKFA